MFSLCVCGHFSLADRVSLLVNLIRNYISVSRLEFLSAGANVQTSLQVVYSTSSNEQPDSHFFPSCSKILEMAALCKSDLFVRHLPPLPHFALRELFADFGAIEVRMNGCDCARVSFADDKAAKIVINPPQTLFATHSLVF